MRTTTFKTRTVRTAPADAANALIESHDLHHDDAIGLVKFLRNPATLTNTQRTRYKRAKQQFSEPTDSGIEWVERYAEYLRDPPDPFIPKKSRADVERTRLSPESTARTTKNDTTSEKKDKWTDSPFSPSSGV